MNSILLQEVQFPSHAFAQKAGSIDSVERERERERERGFYTYYKPKYFPVSSHPARGYFRPKVPAWDEPP